MKKTQSEQLSLVQHPGKYLYLYVLWSKSNWFEVLFENDVCTLRNSFIVPFLKNSQIENCTDALWSGKRKLSKNALLKDFQWDFSGLEPRTSTSNTRIKVTYTMNWMLSCVLFLSLYVELL